ncbi:MAG: TSUP family transporter [Acidiferrobacterales bacterium]
MTPAPAPFIVTLVCSLTYSFEIVFGLAGTILMLATLTLLYSAKTLVIYSVLPQILAGTIGLARSPRTVRLGFLGGMLAFASLGGAIGLFLFYRVPASVFHYLLATLITLAGLHLVMGPRRLRLHPAGGRVLDTLAGMSQALFGISGPIAMTRLLATFSDKTIVRNYALAFFLALNILRTAGYLLAHTITPQIGRLMLYSGPFVATALWFSNHLHFRVNETLFRRVAAWIILASGLSMFLH